MNGKVKHKDFEKELGKIEKPDWFESIQSSQAFNSLVEHRRNLPYIFVILVLVIGISFKVMSYRSQSAESSFLLAQNYQAKIIQSLAAPNGKTTEINALNDLDKITEVYQELQPKYDGLVGELFLINGDISRAEIIAERVVKRTGKDQNLNQQDLTTTTFMIANGNYQEGLSQAKALQGKLTDKEKATLAYNVLRMAMLQQELGDLVAEKEIWDLWKNLSEQPANAEAFALVSGQFKEGNFTLADYIDERNKVFSLMDRRVSGRS